MLNRRELVRSGLWLGAVGVLAPRIAAAGGEPAGIWIVDRQLPGAAALTAAAESRAAQTIAFTADPGQVWMRTVEPRLKTGPIAVAGYTTAPVLFCLHYLARDYGLALARLGAGPRLPETLDEAADALLDLRDPLFSAPHSAHSWLLLPRRA